VRYLALANGKALQHEPDTHTLTERFVNVRLPVASSSHGRHVSQLLADRPSHASGSERRVRGEGAGSAAAAEHRNRHLTFERK